MVYGDALSASFAPQECIPHSWETFSSLFVSQGCCRALMGNVISHFATEVADEGVVWVEEERKCGGEYGGGTNRGGGPVGTLPLCEGFHLFLIS